MPTETILLVAYLTEHASSQKEQIATLSEASKNFNHLVELQKDRIRCLESEKELRVEPSSPIEISATAKPPKRKSKKTEAPLLTTDQLDLLIFQGRQSYIEDFGDARARSGSLYSAVAVKSKQTGQIDVIFNKYRGYHVSDSHHTIALDSNGVSRAYDVDPSDKNCSMLTLVAYRDYFLFFPYSSGWRLIDQRIDSKSSSQPLFKSPHAARGRKGSSVYSSNNFNRNVQLECDNLYFIDTNCHVVQYDLKQLLSTDGSINPNYKPTFHRGPFEDFSVCAQDSSIATLSSEGILLVAQRPTKQVDLKTLETGQLGDKYGTIETLGGYYVVASYSSTNKTNSYSVFSSQLVFHASLSTKDKYDGGTVHAMLLYQRPGGIHILSILERCIIEHHLFASKKVHLITQEKVSGTVLLGLVWRVESKEALVMGDDALLKSWMLK